MAGQVWWYLARAAGIVTLVLLAGTFVLGILFSTRALKPHDRPAWLLAMHRWFSTLVVIGTGLHVLALVLDSFVAFGPREILVPMTSRWRPVAVSFGVVAMYLLVVVHVSSLLMKRIPKAWWRRMHALSAGLVWCAVVHGALAGTDVANPAYQAMAWTLLLAAVGAGLVRVVLGRSAARAAAGRAARTAESPRRVAESVEPV
jgi:predicted ferric reductase